MWNYSIISPCKPIQTFSLLFKAVNNSLAWNISRLLSSLQSCHALLSPYSCLHSYILQFTHCHPSCSHTDPWPANNYEYLFVPLKITVSQRSVLDGSGAAVSIQPAAPGRHRGGHIDGQPRRKRPFAGNILGSKESRLWSLKMVVQQHKHTKDPTI